MNAGSWEWYGYVGLVGLAYSGAFLLRLMFKLDINTNMFMEQMRKLILSGASERALKLCQVLPNAIAVQGVAAVITAWSQDKVLDPMGLRTKYDEAEMHWRRGTNAGLAGLVFAAAAGGLAVALSWIFKAGEYDRPEFLIGSAAALLSIIAIVKLHSLTAKSEQMREDIVSLLQSVGTPS